MRTINVFSLEITDDSQPRTIPAGANFAYVRYSEEDEVVHVYYVCDVDGERRSTRFAIIPTGEEYSDNYLHVASFEDANKNIWHIVEKLDSNFPPLSNN
jgi:hypothetical protein